MLFAAVSLFPSEIGLSPGAQLELVLNLLSLKHQGSVKRFLAHCFFPRLLVPAAGPL